jgi:hypothetical protein
MKHYRKTQRGGGLYSAIEHEQAVAAKTTGIKPVTISSAAAANSSSEILESP